MTDRVRVDPNVNDVQQMSRLLQTWAILGMMHSDEIAGRMLMDAIAVVLHANGGSIEVKASDCDAMRKRGYAFAVGVVDGKVRVEEREAK